MYTEEGRASSDRNTFCLVVMSLPRYMGVDIVLGLSGIIVVYVKGKRCCCTRIRDRDNKTARTGNPAAHGGIQKVQ
jgi:hypothetical protein